MCHAWHMCYVLITTDADNYFRFSIQVIVLKRMPMSLECNRFGNSLSWFIREFLNYSYALSRKLGEMRVICYWHCRSLLLQLIFCWYKSLVSITGNGVRTSRNSNNHKNLTRITYTSINSSTKWLQLSYLVDDGNYTTFKNENWRGECTEHVLQ
jgi:hypothetical protein